MQFKITQATPRTNTVLLPMPQTPSDTFPLNTDYEPTILGLKKTQIRL